MLRLLTIFFVLARSGLFADFLKVLKKGDRKGSLLRLLHYSCCLFYKRANLKTDRGTRLRKTLERLGPISIKFGQTLSTRHDLFPEDIIDALSHLQDRVPPFPGEIAIQMIEKTYQQPVAEIFEDFSVIPLASASIAQVHTASIEVNGKKKSVIVKLLRPQIAQQINRDMCWMRKVATLFEWLSPSIRRFKPKAVIDEFWQTTLDEIDLQREAANASTLKRNFKDSNLLFVPTVYWDYCHSNIFVSERIYGIQINDIKQLKAHQVDFKQLAERGVEIFFTQVLRDRFFHADMHPGNVFVDVSTSPVTYMAIDFGIMGVLNKQDQYYLAENLVAFFNRDYHKVAQLHVDSGWVNSNTRIEQFESAIRSIAEPIFERPLKDISFGMLLLRLFQVAKRFDMQVQPQLILLQKTLLHVEGLGRTLYPELDLWTTAKPLLEGWVKSEVHPKQVLCKIKDRLPFWLAQAAEMPDLIYDVLREIKGRSS